MEHPHIKKLIKNLTAMSIIVFIVIFTPLSTAQINTPVPNVSIEPSKMDIKVGNTFTVKVSVDPDNYEIYGAQFYLNYTSSILNVTKMIKGPFLTQDGASSFSLNVCDNVANKCTYAETRYNTTIGVSEPGILATITFKANAVGVSSLDLNNVLLADPSGVKIDGIVVNDGIISVKPLSTPTPTPTPAPTPKPTSTPTPTPTPTKMLMEGDTNLNKHVTITDVMLISKYKAGTYVLTPDQLKCADTNDDGSVSIVDALYIAKWLADQNIPLWDPVKDFDMLKPVP